MAVPVGSEDLIPITITPNPAQVDPRSDAERLSDQIEATQREALPVCPYCASEDGVYTFRQFDVGPWVAVQIFCGNPDCRRLFNVQIIGPSKQAMNRAMERSRIVTPH